MGGIKFKGAFGDEVAAAIGLGPFTGTVIPNGYVLCSYCIQEGKVGKAQLTPKMTATVGVMKPRKILGTNVDFSFTPPKFMGDKVTHVSDEKVACPDHAGELVKEKFLMKLKWPRRGPNT